MVLYRVGQSHPSTPPPPRSLSLHTFGEPEAGYGKVKGQPLLNDISGDLEEGRQGFVPGSLCAQNSEAWGSRAGTSVLSLVFLGNSGSW